MADEYILKEEGLSYRYRKEIPSPEIKRDALFYVFTCESQKHVFSTEYARDVNSIAVEAGPDSPTWYIGSPYTPVVDLPPQIKGWRMELLTFPPEVIAPYLTDFSIDEAYADWFPDIHTTMNSLVVTAQVRHVIESLDPGFHYFYPISIHVTETGDPLPGERYHWIPRRRMNDIMPSRPDPRPGMFSVWEDGGFSQRPRVWEYTNNPDLRDFLRELPFWAEGLQMRSFAMSRPVFHRLKSELFTGLLELECEDRYDEDCDRTHNVGHF